jgi:CzcA family heavy metal efflux pump
MNLAHWAAKHRRSILFFFLILTIAGGFSVSQLPQGMFPNINFPRIAVTIEAGDQPADQMVIAVTRKIEEAVRPVPGVHSIRSTTSRGSAEASINFNWGQDMGSALLQVESAINQSLPNLPPGTKFTVRRMDPTVFPVIAYSLTSDQLSQVTIRDIGQQQLVPLLSSIEGIAKVAIMGGDQAEFLVEIDPEKMASYDLAFSDVTQALSASNVLKAVGRLEDHYKLYLNLADTRLHDIKSIRNTILRSGTNGLVRLQDIAKITKSVTPNWLKTSADGKAAAFLMIFQQPKSNAVYISDQVKKRLADYQSKLPHSLHLSKWYDQSELIHSSTNTVRDAIMIGVLLAALILFLFLRNLKITLIALIIVPAALSVSALTLYLLGASFNIMTLGGMAAAVGLIVDDGIVMIEHIVRRMRDNKDQSNDRDQINHSIREAAIEFTKPLMGSSAATIIIFIPLAFLSGVTGSFFQALSLTMASALFASFMIAWLAVPLLAEHLLTQKDAQVNDTGALFKVIQTRYQRLMKVVLNKPIWIWLGILPFVLASGLAFHNVGSGFMPHMDEGGFILDFVQKPGTSIPESERVLRQVEQVLIHHPAIQTYSARLGGQLGGGLTETNQGDFFVRLKPFPRPGIDQVMTDVRTEIASKIPGIEVETALLMEDVIGDLTAVPQPIEIKLYGDNFPLLMKVATQVAEKVKNISGVVEVKNGIILAGDAITTVIDREKAAFEGVDPENVTNQMTQWLTGIVTTQIQEGIKLVGVRVWTPKSARTTIEDIGKMMIRAPDGHLFPLNRIAEITPEIGQPQITRENLKRMVAVTGRISGRDMGSTIADIKHLLNTQKTLPSSVYYEMGGLYQQQQIAFKGLISVFVAALALIFLLLLFLYEDIAAAIAILVPPLLATGMVFMGLWLTNMELNITAMMGMTMIIGIVTEVSIFYFSEFQTLIKEGVEQNQAIIQAGVNRMRPIAMTTLAAILALIPLALALGQGSEMQQPLAIAIISGLLVQIPLVIIVMPLVYQMFSKPFFKRGKPSKNV